MHTRRKLIVGIIVAVGALVMSSCASTKMQSITQAPDFRSAQIRKVLIVSIASTPEIRKLVEAEYARQWQERGVTAVASFTVLPPDISLDKAGIAPYAKKQGYDSVLVTRLMKRQKIRAQTPDDAYQAPTPAASEQTDLTGYINTVVASPQYATNYELAVLRTNLYDVASERQLWSGMSHTLVAEDIPKRVGPFVKVILSQIYNK